MIDYNNPSLLSQSDLNEVSGTQYLTFELAGEVYGVNILQVQEIRGWEHTTRIPNAPKFVKGVVNLRGTIVPVYDLRLRFGMPSVSYGKQTVVIVVRVGHESPQRSLGMVVDAVSDVVVVADDQITMTPEFGANVPTENIRGIVNAGDRMVMLLDTMHLIQRGSDHADSIAA